MRKGTFRRRERGASLLEFSFTGIVLVATIFATFDFGRLLWAHNAIGDAVVAGARYAVSHPTDSATMAEIRNVVVYGNKAGGARPIVSGLTTNMVQITYDGMALGSGAATIKVVGYQFQFVSLIGLQVSLGSYRTSLNGETVGWTPAAITPPAI